MQYKPLGDEEQCDSHPGGQIGELPHIQDNRRARKVLTATVIMMTLAMIVTVWQLVDRQNRCQYAKTVYDVNRQWSESSEAWPALVYLPGSIIPSETGSPADVTLYYYEDSSDVSDIVKRASFWTAAGTVIFAGPGVFFGYWAKRVCSSVAVATVANLQLGALDFAVCAGLAALTTIFLAAAWAVSNLEKRGLEHRGWHWHADSSRADIKRTLPEGEGLEGFVNELDVMLADMISEAISDGPEHLRKRKDGSSPTVVYARWIAEDGTEANSAPLTRRDLADSKLGAAFIVDHGSYFATTMVHSGYILQALDGLSGKLSKREVRNIEMWASYSTAGLHIDQSAGMWGRRQEIMLEVAPHFFEKYLKYYERMPPDGRVGIVMLNPEKQCIAAGVSTRPGESTTILGQRYINQYGGVDNECLSPQDYA